MECSPIVFSCLIFEHVSRSYLVKWQAPKDWDFGSSVFGDGDKMKSVDPCAFCTLPPERITYTIPFGLVIREGFQILRGHKLMIPKGHVDLPRV